MSAFEAATSPSHLMTLFAERIAIGDVDGLIALYEPTAVFEPRPRTVLRGIDHIRPALAELAALRPEITYAGDPGVVIIDDIAMVSNTWKLTATLPDGARHREGGLSADVLRRQADGSWLIVIDQPRGSVISA
jgi:ketosteroid isomerase-like protein